jgi:hypothetical protein
MAQDFWASTGFAALERTAEGLVATDAWLARFATRPELEPPPGAGAREEELHARFIAEPRADLAAALDALEDADARDNWAQFLRFRDRVLAHPTLEACYLSLFGTRNVDIPPVFVDALAQVIVRATLEGTTDAWLARAGELLFRKQRVSVEGGQVLAADAATIEIYAESGGFGAVGKLLRAELPEVKMDVLNRENAPFYWMRDELYGFALDLTPDREGAAALARVLERWVARLVGTRVAIEPVAQIRDERWRWHLGLDVDSSALLDAIYRGETLAPHDLERLVLLFRLTFEDPADALTEMAGRPVYLGLGVHPDRTLKVKPQNLLVNLPLSHRPQAG